MFENGGGCGIHTYPTTVRRVPNMFRSKKTLLQLFITIIFEYSCFHGIFIS